MRPSKPPFKHPPEVYQTIIHEHRGSPTRMAERLVHFSWAMADAAWAAVHWEILWLAAAIANERSVTDAKYTTAPKAEPADPKVETKASKASAIPKPKRTTRLVRASPKITPRLLRKPEKPNS